MQPFVAKRSAPRLVVAAGARASPRALAALEEFVAELTAFPVSGLRLAAVNSTANVPYAASSAIDLSTSV
jgi:hypothetical protein